MPRKVGVQICCAAYGRSARGSWRRFFYLRFLSSFVVSGACLPVLLTMGLQEYDEMRFVRI